MRNRTALAILLAFSPLLWAAPAWSLSEIQREDLPAPQQAAPPGASDAPAPDAASPGATPPAGTDQAAPSDEDAPADEAAPDTATPDTQPSPDDAEAVAPQGPLPAVSYDIAALPEPVRKTYDLLLDACKSADIEKLRPLLGTGDDATQLSITDFDGDAIDFLKQASGDGGGLEILAILEEVLSAGYVHTDIGSDEELYVWPYFFAIPLDKLTNRQQVELFKIVTAGDVEEMKTVGAYIFYRVGITPKGRFAFFVAGD